MNKLATYFSFVRFSHTVFALPFALTGALLAWREQPFRWTTVGWIVLCMVSARSAAMGFNRIVDARYDALNPRTAMRELPRGAMSAVEATAFVVLSSIVFIYGAWRLSPLCLALSPVALALVFWYSLAKRYTAYTQLFLALAMAGAPVGGFDVLYACQDFEFDRAQGLRSIPTRFGIATSIRVSRIMHVATVVFMAALWRAADLPALYLAGVAVVAVLLAYEQSLVSDDDLSQVKKAFDLNGWVGIVYFLSTAASLYLA